MDSDNDTPLARETRGDGVSRMVDACLRISASLDHTGILQEVIDSARSLAGARYGALVAFDEDGAIGEFFTSGMTGDERRRMGDLPRGLGLLGYLNEVREPLRLRDIGGHPRSVGFPEGHPQMRTFLGDAVGNIYLTEKEGGREFSKGDEDTLVLFASQRGGRHLQRAEVRAREAGEGRPRGPHRHLARRRHGLRREERGPAVEKRGDEADRRTAERPGTLSLPAVRGDDPPNRGRSRDSPRRASDDEGAETRRDGACRGGGRPPRGPGGRSTPWSTPGPSTGKAATQSPS